MLKPLSVQDYYTILEKLAMRKGTSTLLGMKLAERYGEKPDILNAIGAHHDEIEMTTLSRLLFRFVMLFREHVLVLAAKWLRRTSKGYEI